MRRLARGRATTALGVALACVAVAGCGSSKSSSSSTSGSGSSSSASSASAASSGKGIDVLAIVDESGPTKAYGSQELLGIRAGAAYWNAHGGIDGHKVTVTAMDDGGSAATATSLLVKALGSDPSKYTMVYPGSEGTETASLTPLLTRYHVFAIAIDDGNSACVNAAKCPNEFAQNGPQSNPATADANFFKAHGIKKVGILTEQVTFTQSEIPPLEAALAKDGIQYVQSTFPATATNVSSEMSDLKSHGAQAVFAAAVGPPAAYALQARQALGWNADVVFDVAGSSLDITKLVSSQSLIAKAWETAPYCMDTAFPHPGLQQLYKYAPSERTSDLPCDLSGAGWDAMYDLDEAVVQAKSLSASALTQAEENLSMAAQTNPIQVVRHRTEFSTSNHENIGETPADTPIIPVGPIVGGQIKGGKS